MTPPAFLADAMLGKLARDLRALGYDAEYRRETDDEPLLDEARDHDRILLTRDTQLADRAGPDALLIESKDPLEQLESTLQRLEITPDADRFLTRCLDCNRPLEATHAPHEVPEGREDEPHWRCPACEKTYWIGTHAHAMLSRFEHLLDEDPPILDADA